MALDNELAKFLQSVDDCFKTLVPSDEKYEWTSLLRTTKHNETTGKVNVCLSGEDSALTFLKFMHKGKVLSGKGWDFLKKHADAEKEGAYAFGGGETKVVVKLRGWSMTGKDGVLRKGLSLAATHVFIKPREGCD
jgi:hypothetical protein